jgi:hypothetical protein
MQLGDAALGQFSNGEKSVEIRTSPSYKSFGIRGVDWVFRLLGEKPRCVYCTIGIRDVNYPLDTLKHIY